MVICNRCGKSGNVRNCMAGVAEFEDKHPWRVRTKYGEPNADLCWECLHVVAKIAQDACKPTDEAPIRTVTVYPPNRSLWPSIAAIIVSVGACVFVYFSR